MNKPIYLTSAEAAARLKVSTARIQALLLEGRIPAAFKVGRHWMIPRAFRVLPTKHGPAFQKIGKK
jgi:excisionase family DNA binding protein